MPSCIIALSTIYSNNKLHIYIIDRDADHGPQTHPVTSSRPVTQPRVSWTRGATVMCRPDTRQAAGPGSIHQTGDSDKANPMDFAGKNKDL